MTIEDLNTLKTIGYADMDDSVIIEGADHERVFHLWLLRKKNGVVNWVPEGILEERFLPDMEGNIIYPLKELLKPYLQTSTLFDNAKLYAADNAGSTRFRLIIYDGGIESAIAEFAVFPGHASQENPSVIASMPLCVPPDHIVPIPFDSGEGVDICTRTICSRCEVGASCFQIPATGNPVWLKDVGTGAILSPIMNIVPGTYESFLFLNEDSDFECIPMRGKNELVVDSDFMIGRFSGSRKKIYSSATKTYRQNSGLMDRGVIEALATLLHGERAWHLKNNIWQEIIITGSETAVNSHDSLHSLTFEYEYVNIAI